MDKEKVYIAIDLKSFYASVECMDRGLDPLTTNLVVADGTRTQKTICLAISPSMKALGISGRPRLFQVVSMIKNCNANRLRVAPEHKFTGSSVFAPELKENASLAVDYIEAPPRMARYMEVSSKIYGIYLNYIAAEDIHVYSIDEVFMDVTGYMRIYNKSPHDLAKMMILDVLKQTGITATAGIGSNLYLAKVAMDIVAKKLPPDRNGVRIAQLDEMEYRRQLWNHRPLTDFWRIGTGYTRRLESNGLFTMGDVARCSLGSEEDYYNEDLLYKLFGINAELLIDHAWGWEPCTMKEIKAYKPMNNSLTQGQVLHMPYTWDKGRLVVQEMTELLCLDMVKKGLVTDQIVLSIGYDIKNLEDPEIRKNYHGEVVMDGYGRCVPKHAHGSRNLPKPTASFLIIKEAMMELFDAISDPNLLIRRFHVNANHVIPEKDVEKEEETFEQLNLFTDYEARDLEEKERNEKMEKERKQLNAVLEIKNRYGKNAIFKGTNLQEGATTLDRNKQIGGHKA